MDWLTIAIMMIGVAALLPALLLSAQTWEFRRFVLSRIASPKTNLPTPRVLLFAPCKGLDRGLTENLRPLFEQDYPDYHLTLIVESESDPACEPIRALMKQYPGVDSQLIVAGRATHSGQKVHNLIEATADLGDAELLAFVDSDARPRPQWLRQLVQHLHRPQTAAATGYRWFVPERNTLPNLLLHSVNAAVASLVGPSRHHMVWGGAWAIRRDVFESIQLREQWSGTLSDDLVAARELANSRKKLEFEPACMTASPLDVSWSEMFEFVRRQYTVARFYSPLWWSLAMVFCTIAQLAFWGGLMATAYGAATRATWTLNMGMLPLGMYLTYVFRASLRQNAAEAFLPEQQSRLKRAASFDVWFAPLAGLVNWCGMFGSLMGNRITWRTITYAIHRGGQISIMDRPHDPPAVVVPLRKAG